MAQKRIDKSAALLGCTVYIDNKLISRDCKVTLPTISNETVEGNYMGKMEVPIPGQYGNLDVKITFPGHEASHTGATTPKWHDIEVRVVQMDLKADISEVRRQIIFKMNGWPKESPIGDIEVGSNAEREITYNLRKFQQYIDGKEVRNLDRSKGIDRFDGVDYNDPIKALL